ncbi:hypothetical protein E0Z10_g4212 [Xylaria hypoxylon]|uniref:Uncharacterized protein n=1 Tax=Xylaria hypoxylon TaxID=37992 RepID=A0A4Z0YLR7_9PEZI|nr:hypothetical protein E0Z10_g4212 [Xylaria hypoxylon]
MVETTSPSTALSTATPKRKRDEMIAGTRLSASPTPHHVAKTVFSFQPPNLQPTIRSDNPTEDGNSSPQSRVARKFRDLAIEESGEDREGREGTTSGGEPESGGGATAAAGTLRWRSGSGHERLVAPDLPRFDFDAGAATAQVDMQLDSDGEDTTTGRKRPKTFELDISSPEPTTNTLPGETNDFTIQTLPGCDPETHHLSASVDSRIASAFEVGKSGKLQKSYPSINRLADSKSRCRKRTGTPPFSSRRKGSAQSQSARQDEEKEESVVVDPVRAALTWREDEITVYDPEDKDDDGTGINGIGFKPTPAVAYQRAQKRRQQLSEYKKREEREARARRTQRRAGAGAEMTRKHSIVRVHFSDAPPTTLMTT